MTYFPITFPATFDPVLQPDILLALREFLLESSDVVNYVTDRGFVLQIPQGTYGDDDTPYVGSDCIVISDTPSIGAEPEGPITHLTVQVDCYSQDLATSRYMERKCVFPLLHQYTEFVTGTDDYGYNYTNNYSISIMQSQSQFTTQDTDYVGEYWKTTTEYDIFLRY